MTINANTPNVFSGEYALNKWDTNKDGKTTVTEFLECHNNSLFDDEKLNKRAIDLLKKRISDGIMTPENYEAYLGCSEYRKILDENTIFDADRILKQRKDGTYAPGLSETDLNNLLKNKKQMDECASILKEKEKLLGNGDGTLTVDEFIAELEKLKEYSGDLYNRAVDELRKLCPDGNITPERYQRWLQGKEYGRVIDDATIQDAEELRKKPASKSKTTFNYNPQSFDLFGLNSFSLQPQDGFKFPNFNGFSLQSQGGFGFSNFGGFGFGMPSFGGFGFQMPNLFQGIGNMFNMFG